MSFGGSVDDFVRQVRISARSTAVDPGILTELGRVVANFALLERELALLIRGLLGAEKSVSLILTSELSTKQLIDVSASLVRSRHSAQEVRLYTDVLAHVNRA